MCSDNYWYISDKSRRAVFRMKLKFVWPLTPPPPHPHPHPHHTPTTPHPTPHPTPPQVYFWYVRYFNKTYSYVYGNDVRDLSKAVLDFLDKVFLNLVRCTLNVKATICNAIVYGECGRCPLSVFCLIIVLRYLHRSLTMHTRHGQGFTTWVTKTYDLTKIYDIDMNAYAGLTAKQFKSLCAEGMKSYMWKIGILNFAINLYWDRINCTKWVQHWMLFRLHQCA